jgi:small subunit ribosomal protein S17
VETQKRGKAKTREGVVLSDKMDKTVVVLVERLVQHAKYKKRLRRRAKVKAHDEQNRCSIGDRVIIAETRPLSRDKRWTVRQVLEKAV